MDFGIVNSDDMLAIDEVESILLKACEELAFNKSEEATERMLLLTTREKEL
jgi:cobalamin-dependent methionine synthase I